MREVALDTETTGLSPFDGDKMVEIGCVEMINHVATGKTFHCYLNPERNVPEEVVKIHGLTNDFLKDKPVFKDIADDFLKFIFEAKLVIHNASFDMGFINNELVKNGKQPLPMENVIDTLTMARRRFPGDRANLDSLCKRFGVDNSNRTKHGALLDAELLAEVYLELIGGREPGLSIAANKVVVVEKSEDVKKTVMSARSFPISEDEIEKHRSFLKEIENPVWNNIE